MHICGIDFPNQIIEAINNKKLVVFVGAGVSMGKPTSLPDFEKLTEMIAEGTGLDKNKNESCEAFLGRLECQGIDVNRRAADILSQKKLRPNELHKYIVHLFPCFEDVKIVTTNYDDMFEKMIGKKALKSMKIFNAPALPLGDDVTGIIHVHGNVNEPLYMVVTDEDFGKAYLSESYVSRFLVKLFENYTILFIGYSYNDVIVRYLTRAMTRNAACPRYILIDDTEGNWKELGVQPILYPYKDYLRLNEAINQLGIRIGRGLLDWENSLRMIAERPPVDLTIESEVLYCLESDERTRILIKSIHGKEWLQWLDDRNVFNHIFDNDNQLSKIDIGWAEWIADEFINTQVEVILKMVYKHNNCVNGKFAEILVNRLDDEKIERNETDVRRIVSLIQDYIEDSWSIWRLHDYVMKRGMCSFGWGLFKRFYNYRMITKKELTFLDEASIEFECRFFGERYSIRDAWRKYGQKHKDYNSLEILEFGKERIESIHASYINARLTDSEYGSYELCNTQIEDGKKNYGDDESIQLLCKIIIEVCSYISTSEEEYVKQYIRCCVCSNAVLLRRIGLKLLRESMLFSADEKFELGIRKAKLNGLFEKEQIFLLAASIFDDISRDNQEKLFVKIRNMDKRGDEQTQAYEKFNWAVWLRRNCRESDLILGLIQEVKEKYPFFEERKNPQLDWDFESASWGGDKSPKSAEEIYSMETEDFIQLLLNYKEKSWEGPNRDGLLLELSKCAKGDCKWVCNVLLTLIERGIDAEDIWSYLFRGISNADFTLPEYLKIFEVVEESRILCKHINEMSYIFEKCIDLQDAKKGYQVHKARLHALADKFWSLRQQDEDMNDARLIDQCVNCSTGLLSTCWIKMLSYEKTDGIPEEYMKRFEGFLGRENPEQRQSICILVGQVAYLFAKDSEWTKDNILPFLQSADENEFTAAWEGVAWFSRRLNMNLADSMLDIYRTAVKRINSLTGEARKGFVELYTLLMIYAIEAPIKLDIPQLFAVANQKDRLCFIKVVENCLESMNENQKNKLWNSWLKKYWSNRLVNIPCSLNEEEGKNMMGWLPKLGNIYPEAVEKFVLGTPIKKVDGYFFHCIEDKQIMNQYAKETIRLIKYLIEKDAFESYDIHRVSQLVKSSSYVKPEEIEELRVAFLGKGYQL